MPPSELDEEIKEKAQELGKPFLTPDGLLKLEYYKKAMRLVAKYVTAKTEDKIIEMTKKRRLFLQQEDHENYAASISKMLEFQNLSNLKVHELFFSAVGVPQKVLLGSRQRYMSQPNLQLELKKNL